MASNSRSMDGSNTCSSWEGSLYATSERTEPPMAVLC